MWTCFAAAQKNNEEWTHFYYEASSGHCSLRGNLTAFDFMAFRHSGRTYGKFQERLSNFMAGTILRTLEYPALPTVVPKGSTPEGRPRASALRKYYGCAMIPVLSLSQYFELR